MKARIMILVTVLMMGLSSLALAHCTGGSIQGIRSTSDGIKVIIYTSEGYSIASVQAFSPDYPLRQGDIIETNCGYLTDIGQVSIHDLATGYSGTILSIEGFHLSGADARTWLNNGGQFLD